MIFDCVLFCQRCGQFKQLKGQNKTFKLLIQKPDNNLNKFNLIPEWLYNQFWQTCYKIPTRHYHKFTAVGVSHGHPVATYLARELDSWKSILPGVKCSVCVRTNWLQSISILEGTNGGYGSGFLCDGGEKRPWEWLISKKWWQLVKRLASVTSEPESISSLKEEQRMPLKACLRGRDVFTLLPTGFGKSLIHQLALDVDLIGGSLLDMTDRWFIQPPSNCFLKVPSV